MNLQRINIGIFITGSKHYNQPKLKNMLNKISLSTLIAALMLMASCTSNKNVSTMNGKTIVEVTTFKINSDADPITFSNLDTQVENNFTSKQPGFIKRQSAIDDKGNYVVIVYWQSQEDAAASMNKFMADASVADYAKMIDGPTMKMARYAIDKTFDADASQFVEIMDYDVKSGTDMTQFTATNYKVESEFTGSRKGFLQRIVGANEAGRQIVVVYWDNKENSDASMQPFMSAPIAKQFMQSMDQTTMSMGRYKFLNAELSNKEKAVALLNSFNTGDQTPVSYINPNKYIQHNLSIGDGLAGFGALMKNMPPQGFKAKVHRAFQDGDYVFTHTEYDFFGPKVGFDVFRFENGLIVEHWDNLLEVQAPNPSGRTQFDGATQSTNIGETAKNKQVVKDLLQNVFMKGQMDKIASYISPTTYIQHNPQIGDGLDGLGKAMQAMGEKGMMMTYEKIHKVLGEGNFILTLSEGKLGNQHTAYYDLFRLENELIVEHWDVIAPIPPKSEWKNENGKF